MEGRFNRGAYAHADARVEPLTCVLVVVLDPIDALPTALKAFEALLHLVLFDRLVADLLHIVRKGVELERKQLAEQELRIVERRDKLFAGESDEHLPMARSHGLTPEGLKGVDTGVGC